MKHSTYSTDRQLEPVGALVVRDETGTTHRVTIRREDLTGTNGAYRAIRDTVTDTLRTVLAVNRATPLEDRKRAETVRVRIEYDTDADWSWFWDHEERAAGHPVERRWGNFGPIDHEGEEHDALALVVEERCPCCGTWDTVEYLGGIDALVGDRTLIGVPAPDGGPYSPDELRTWLEDHEPGTGRHYPATEALEMVRGVAR